MMIAGIVVNVLPGKEASVSKFLTAQSQVSVIGKNKGKLAIVAEAGNSKAMEKMTMKWLDQNRDIISVSPVYIGVDAPERESALTVRN